MKYVAKKKHANPCDLCGDSILPGDSVKWWCWVSEDGAGSGCMGGISRVHATCDVIGTREDCYDESLTDFAAMDESRWDDGGKDGSIPDEAYLLVNEADAALAESRAATPCMDPERLRAALENVRLLVTSRRMDAEAIEHVLRFCREVGVVGSPLRG